MKTSLKNGQAGFEINCSYDLKHRVYDEYSTGLAWALDAKAIEEIRIAKKRNEQEETIKIKDVPRLTACPTI